MNEVKKVCVKNVYVEGVYVKKAYLKNAYVDFWEYEVSIPDEYEEELGDMIIGYADEVSISDLTYKRILERVADEFLATDFWCSVVWDFCRFTDVLNEYEFRGIRTVEDLSDAFLDATRYYLCDMPLRRWFIEYWAEPLLKGSTITVERLDRELPDDFCKNDVVKFIEKGA